MTADSTVPVDPAQEPAARLAGGGGGGGGRRLVKRFMAKRGAVVSLAFLLLLALAATFAGTVARHDPAAQEMVLRYAGPSPDHFLGTDHLGRDLWSRLLHGARISLIVSFGSVFASMVVALPVGMAVGYSGGRIDSIVMRVVDALLSIPGLVLALAITGVRGPGLSTIVLALSIAFLPGLVRFVRGQTLAIREEAYVDASRSIGTPPWLILRLRVLRNLISPLTVQVSLLLGTALLAEAALSYLGLGAAPPTSSWGGMLRDAYDNALFTHGWQLWLPGAAIVVVILAFNTLSDGIRDATGLARAERVRGSVRHGDVAISRHARAAADTAPTRREPALLAVEDLTVAFGNERSEVRVVERLSLSIGHQEAVALVGESGSGKTVTGLAIMRLVPSPPGRIVAGRAWFEGRDIMAMDHRELRGVRGAEVAMVFQDPMSSLNPSRTIDSHLIEAQRLHGRVRRRAARERALEVLELVEIADPTRRLKQYPHELSGGMRQRVMLALALVCRPKLLIADEPTTALDVTVQAQIIALLDRLRRELDMSILFITHDLGVVSQLCDRVVVMYAGEVVEEAPASEIFTRPRHPYTKGLLASTPQLAERTDRLTVIGGMVPNPLALPSGCRFHPRCPFAVDRCTEGRVDLLPTGPGSTRCVRVDELAEAPWR